MTEADLLGDLARLLREGLVQVDQDDDESVERFAVTRRGRTVAADDPLRDEAQTSEFGDAADWTE